MAIVIKKPLVEPLQMYFDMKGDTTRWELLANLAKDKFQIELLPSVFAEFRYTGVMRLFRGDLTKVFVLDQIIEDRKKVQDQLAVLTGVLVLQQEAPSQSL